MLGVMSTTSSSSSPSNEPSALESARASPPLTDMAISSAMIVAGLELLMIPEMPELNVTQSTMLLGVARPHAGASASMLLNELMFAFSCESY
jgi:hypothetical protein